MSEYSVKFARNFFAFESVAVIGIVFAALYFAGLQSANANELLLGGCEKSTTTSLVNTSQYIAMPDGVKIASDVWVPSGCTGTKYPTIVTFTRYWRAFDIDGEKGEALDPFLQYFTGAGYVIVRVDTRGSGASFGSRLTEFSNTEVADYRHIIDWIAEQSWSDGKVATYGISYSGNTSELAMIDASDALKAAVPRFTDYDWYSSILFPGGLQNRIIGDGWAAAVAALDVNDASVYGDATIKGVKPVQKNYEELKQAVAQHDPAPKFASDVDGVVVREDMSVVTSLHGEKQGLVTPYLFQDQISKNAIPAFHWSSWNDAGTADGVLARFASGKVKGRFVIGAWSHGAENDADPLKPINTPPSPNVLAQYKMIDSFLQTSLSGDAVENAPRVLEYYTMGEGAWKTTDVWPILGSRHEKLYLTGDHFLSQSAQIKAAGHRSFDVNFEAGTGTSSRWTTQVGGGDVIYTARDEKLSGFISYTSEPVERDTEITGHTSVYLDVSSSDGRGAVIAYLELMDPQGGSHMVTEGEMKLLHSESRELPDTRWVPVPYHSFSRHDVRQVAPNEIVPVSFNMLPTSIRVPKGYRIRVTIGGHDKDAFSSEGENIEREITIQSNTSYIRLPVIGSQPIFGGQNHDE